GGTEKGPRARRAGRARICVPEWHMKNLRFAAEVPTSIHSSLPFEVHMLRTFAQSLLLTAILAGVLSAQDKPAADKKDKPDSAGWSATIAPFLDEQSIAVVRLDATRLGLSGAPRQLKKTPGGVLGEEFDTATLAAEAAQGGFTAAGGREAYLVASLADLPNRMPFGVIPVSKGNDAGALVRALRPIVTTAGTASGTVCEPL